MAISYDFRREFAATLLLLLVPAASALGAATDEIFGDDFEGFDPVACDSGIPTKPADAIQYAQAMDLCASATVGGIEPGVISAQFNLADGTGTPAAASFAVRPHFGDTVPVFGDSLVNLSTGAAAAPGDAPPAYVAFQLGDDTGTSSGFPSDWLAAHAGIIPSAPSCPSPLTGAAHNAVMLTLSVRVPGNAHSFSIDANFFSADFPEYTCSPYNDVFVALLDSVYAGLPANPVDKNLAQYTAPSSGVYPLGVNLARDDTGLFMQCHDGPTGCTSGAAQVISTCLSTAGLTNTGMDTADAGCGPGDMVGGGTGWLVMRGNVVPGEVITLRFAIWDTSDGTYDSLVLLDHFRWSPVNVTAGTTVP